MDHGSLHTGQFDARVKSRSVIRPTRNKAVQEQKKEPSTRLFLPSRAVLSTRFTKPAAGMCAAAAASEPLQLVAAAASEPLRRG